MARAILVAYLLCFCKFASDAIDIYNPLGGIIVPEDLSVEFAQFGGFTLRQRIPIYQSADFLDEGHIRLLIAISLGNLVC